MAIRQTCPPRRWALAMAAWAALAPAAGGQTVAAKKISPVPVLKGSEVVFMYSADEEAYRAYGATFVGWGKADTAEQVKRHHALGIRCTGSMWCLTAGAKNIHENPALREAVARDIEGQPVAVPWLFDHTYEGTKTYFGCTNHPAFRQHVRQEVRQQMAGGADGLHVDDHLGVAAAAIYFGGGLCDHCIVAFRRYLKAHATPAQWKSAGVKDIDTFDYRDLIRRHAATRQEYMKVRDTIPLTEMFHQFHLEAAAENVRELGQAAQEAAGHPVLLSANAFAASGPHLHVMKHLTHVICEVPQHAEEGARNVQTAIDAYANATRIGKPRAATAGGGDWAFVKTKGCHDLVRFWIALAYAHGQRFMAPHPTRQWCFTETLGTHWYAAPIEEFAPVYRFIRAHADCFDDMEAVAMTGFRTPAHTLCTLRRHGAAGRTVLHVVNRDYDEAAGRMRPRGGLTVRLPKPLVPGRPKAARLLRYDAAPRESPILVQDDSLVVKLPELKVWTLVVLE